MSRYTRPAALESHHSRGSFRSGNTTLGSWLRNRAHRNEASGASRTFVTCATGADVVVGYYTVAASSVSLDVAPGCVRRNMPERVPVILLGRLAVDERHQSAGLGASVLQDAVPRVAGAPGAVGIRAMFVHAIDDASNAFYEHFGFVASPLDERTLFLPMKAIRASIERAGSGPVKSTFDGSGRAQSCPTAWGGSSAAPMLGGG